MDLGSIRNKADNIVNSSQLAPASSSINSLILGQANFIIAGELNADAECNNFLFYFVCIELF